MSLCLHWYLLVTIPVIPIQKLVSYFFAWFQFWLFYAASILFMQWNVRADLLKNFVDFVWKCTHFELSKQVIGIDWLDELAMLKFAK